MSRVLVCSALVVLLGTTGCGESQDATHASGAASSPTTVAPSSGEHTSAPGTTPSPSASRTPVPPGALTMRPVLDSSDRNSAASSSPPFAAGAPKELPCPSTTEAPPGHVAPPSQSTAAGAGITVAPDEKVIVCTYGEKLLLGPAALTAPDVEVARVVAPVAPQDAIGYVVEIEFTPAGAEKFAELSGEAAGGQRVAVLLGDELLFAPAVHSPLTGNVVQVSGAYSQEHAEALADQVNGAIGRS